MTRNINVLDETLIQEGEKKKRDSSDRKNMVIETNKRSSVNEMVNIVRFWNESRPLPACSVFAA